MARTKTGGFPIGFRRGGTPWQQDAEALIGFAQTNGLECIDLQKNADEVGKTFVDAGLLLGSVDLPDYHGLASPDTGRRAEAAAVNTEYIRKCVAFGAKNFFVVVQVEDVERSRAENFKYAVEGYGALADVLEECDAWIVIEGFPTPAIIVTTPESYRAFIRECPARVAVNFDPSHLIRMGIDPIRFLREFAPHVKHVHGKDTEIFTEALYEYGHQEPPLLAKNHGYGGVYWRYTIPGHGQMRWREGFGILEEAGYQGCVSVELEDENFNGSEEGEKQGFILSREFLAGC